MKNTLRHSLSFIVALMMAGLVVGCGTNVPIKTGPTITPSPQKTESSTDVELTEIELDEYIKQAEDYVYKHKTLTEYEAPANARKELQDYGDGTSDVYVYDERDNQIAVLMYDKLHHLNRVFLDEYTDGVKTSGCEYQEGVLISYFVIMGVNGELRVDIVKDTEEKYNVTVKKGSETLSEKCIEFN